MLNKLIETCEYLLNNFPEAQPAKEYLDSRLNSNSQSLFQFGYFPSLDHLNSLTDIVGREALIGSGLLYTREIEDSLGPRTIDFSYFEGYPLILPFKDPYGNAVGLVGRSLLSDEERSHSKVSKYKNSRESSKFKKGNLLFGLYENKEAILSEDAVYVVEGQFDVIKAVERGFRNIVALGNFSMTSYQFSLISRYTTNIFLLLDNDEAGQRGRKSIVEKYGKFANIHNFYLPDEYKDIDEYLTKTNDSSLSFIVRS